MTWTFALIVALVIGALIGAITTYFCNKKFYNRQDLQDELEKNKHELEQYKHELMSHFKRSAQLLDNVADNYRQLCQHMAETSTHLLPEATKQLNSLNFATSLDNPTNIPPAKEPPRDYSSNASGLLRPEKRD